MHARTFFKNDPVHLDPMVMRSAMLSTDRGNRPFVRNLAVSPGPHEGDPLLIPHVQWERDRDHYLSSRGFPETADPFLERLTVHLKARLAALKEARKAGRVTIGSDGALRLSVLEALPIDGIPKRTLILKY